MGYGSNGLSFRTLRDANLQRLPEFKDAKGRPSHTDPNGFDWSKSDWCLAVTGELGEAANIIKKIRRGDYELDDVREQLADELADVVTYLDLLAHRCGIDLGKATERKWNKVSERVGCNIRISGADDDWHRKVDK